MVTVPEKPLILIDGSSYLYRAFHALPPLSNSRGEPTGAVYGVINMLRKLLKEYPTDHVAVIFDAKGKTFRDDLYVEYKANRPTMPDELQIQMEPLHDIVVAMGLPVITIEGVEADDVIATLASQAKEKGLYTLISTGDKDMAQIVCDKITLINTMSNTLLDPEGVVSKFGVPSERIVDYLALIGDKVDNVPGVPKVGPKTAVKWLQHYGDLQGIIKHAHEINGKVGENLRAHLDILPLAKKLVTVHCDLDLTMTLDNLHRQQPDTETLKELYKRWEFKSWLQELLHEQRKTEHAERDYQIIYDKKTFINWVSKIKQASYFAFDTETTALNPIAAELVGLSLAVESGKAVYIPLAHDYENAPKQLPLQWVLKQLKPILEDKAIKKVGHNLKYDSEVLFKYDIDFQGAAFDTMLESYVVDSTASRHDMDSLALKYLGIDTIHYEEVAGKGKQQKTFNEIDISIAALYAAEDADITLKLHEHLWPRLTKHESLLNVYENIECPLMPVLARMEMNGVLIDEKKLQQQSKQLGKRLTLLEKEAYALAGREFNLSSPKQLQEILFNEQKLPILQKTPKGQASTAESVLQELAYDYPLPKLILEYRSLSKLKSTYTDSLPHQIQASSGRVHTSFNQAVAATGRLSSTEPNLQNIPVRTEEGRRIRQAFIAPNGYKILAADYSQIELRIMAHLSKDEGLLSAFEQDLDIHRATASEVFGVGLADVTGEQRRSAKAINFGLIYGMSAFGLARQLGIDRNSAQDYVDRYFHRYPNVKRYMDETRNKAHKQGYVETLFGRRLYLPEINARNHARQRAAERTAINAPMQGTAADIIKSAMIVLDQWFQKNAAMGKMLMQVHDELVFEINEKAIDEVKSYVQKAMEQTVQLTVPLRVAIGVGDNWDEAH